MKKYSLIPFDYKKNDPRSLAYFYPKTLNIVLFAKKMQDFSFYQALEVAEEMAEKQGFLLIPWSCIHWKRAKNFGNDRKIKIGRKSYFLMKESELTKTEKIKLELYLDELQDEYKTS